MLLTDADIAHHPDNLAELVARLESDGLDLASLMVKLNCASFAERALIPAFVFFFAKLYPFAWVNDRSRRTAGAAGGCMLVRRAALDRIGGVASISGALIDDCALARKIKAGTICVNTHNYGDPARPFGGFKQSGWGREMGKEVMEHYTETKSVAVRL